MTTPPTLTGAEKKQLRGQAQRLKVHVHIGKQGVTDNVIKELNTALTQHELIKVRFETERSQFKPWTDSIVEKAQCTAIGAVGKTASFYRKRQI